MSRRAYKEFLCVAFGIFSMAGCGSGSSSDSCASELTLASAAIGPMKCGGGPTVPSGETVSSIARKPAGAGLTTHPVKQESSAQACGVLNVGNCGCLAPSAWYSDGNNIYDVVCCTAMGSAYSLYSCTDAYNCDDSGADVVCTLNGAPTTN
jgi:hypothetical protein